jgi:hypothetical protein
MPGTHTAAAPNPTTMRARMLVAYVVLSANASAPAARQTVHSSITRRAPQRSTVMPIGIWTIAYVQKYAVCSVPAAAYVNPRSVTNVGIRDANAMRCKCVCMNATSVTASTTQR